MLEHRAVELRQDGRTLTGRAVTYGDVARLPWGVVEIIEARAFGAVDAIDILLNVQHDRKRMIAGTGGGGLVLTDSAQALDVRAELPPTREADDTLELVRRRILRGLSIEFETLRERQDGQRRIIERAELSGLAVVDRPAYRSSTIEARSEIRRVGRGLSGAFYYDTDAIISDRQGERPLKVRKRRFTPDSFDYALTQSDREITLLLGDYSKPLGSKLAGTLNLTNTERALKFSVARLPDTTYARDFQALLDSETIVAGVVPFYAVPPQDAVGTPAVEIIPEPGNDGVGIEVVHHAVLQALAIQFRPPRGNPGAVTMSRGNTRRKFWL